MVITIVLAIKNDHWWTSFFVVLYLYYFIFIANLFVKSYTNENALTRLFFGLTEMPLIVAGIMIVSVIVFIRKQFPDFNQDAAYLNAIIGGLATTIGRYKRGKLIKRQA